MAFPLAFHLQNKVVCCGFVFCSMHLSCSTGNPIPFSNRPQILAISKYFTAKGSWEEILNIPIPSSRIFFQASLCISIESSMTLRAVKMSIHQTNWKEHSLSEQALLSLLRSKRVIPAASPSSVTPNPNAFRTLGSIQRERACHCSGKLYGKSFHSTPMLNHFV